MATSRLSFRSRARYTSPIPPLPRRAVIASEPSRVPTPTDIGISVEMQIALRGIMPRSDKGKQTQQRRQLKLMDQNGFQVVKMLMWSTCLVNRDHGKVNGTTKTPVSPGPCPGHEGRSNRFLTVHLARLRGWD